jgi:hypothetical protein
VDEEPVTSGIDIGHTCMTALVVQVAWRDSSDKLVEWRLRVNGLAGIDGPTPRRGLRDTLEVNVFGSLTGRGE